jgi:menaquinone-dependent protoporphyrinogen oxidase
MNKPGKISRRNFLILAGGTLSASALCCAGIGVSGLSQPPITFIEAQFGEEHQMGKKVLVVYASKCGSTGEVAEAVGKKLAQAGAAVDVRRVQEVKDVQGYDAVVIGSATRMGRILPEAVQFAQGQSTKLARLPAAYFTVCMALKEDSPDKREEAAGYLQPLVEVQAPAAALGLFAGKVDYSKLGWLIRTMARMDKSGGMGEGDWRDWQAIDDWAGSITSQLGL